MYSYYLGIRAYCIRLMILSSMVYVSELISRSYLGASYASDSIFSCGLRCRGGGIQAFVSFLLRIGRLFRNNPITSNTSLYSIYSNLVNVRQSSYFSKDSSSSYSVHDLYLFKNDFSFHGVVSDELLAIMDSGQEF